MKRNSRFAAGARSATLAVWLALVLVFAPQTAWATQPTISQALPPGGQRGSEVDFTIDGKRLEDSREILWYDDGIAVDHLDFAKGKLNAKLKIAANCRLGEHAFRLRTASGLSELRTFWVGTLPTVMEKEPNNELDKAQKIDLNVTVTGVITGEDVDTFAVDAKAGQRLVAVVEGLRLGRAMFDPRVAVLDSHGKQVTLSDDHPLVRQDCIAALAVPEDGRYFIQLRDSSYNGSDNFNYRLHIGTFPQPTAVLPLGGKPGEEIEFHFLGDLSGEFTQKIRLPKTPDSDFTLFAEDADGIAAAGIPVRVSSLLNIVEPQTAGTPPHALAKDAITIETPSAINGIIAAPKESDFYRFKAKKGEVFDINCYARRLRSPLDSVVQVFRINANGNAPQVAANDDANGPDSYLRFTAPDDGDYAVSVKDQLGRGGPTFTYRLELTHVAPSMVVQIPKVQQFSQDRQTVIVPRGNRYVARVGVDRKDFGGDVALSASDLPDGLAMSEETINGAVPNAPVLFEADADAPISSALSILSGRLADPKQNIPSEYRQVTELVIGDNQNPYWSYTASHLAVVVTEEAPFTLDLIEPKVPLVQNGSMQLKVVAHRDPDFKAPIALELIHSAPGVTNASNVSIPEGQNEATIPLNANGKPGNGEWKMAVLGKASVKGGDVYVSTQLATLKVAPAFVQVALNRAAGEQGQTAEVVGKIQHTTTFEGKAKAILVGLPNKVTAPEMEIDKDTQEVTFPLTIDPQSPVGRHKGLACQVVITQDGEPINHTFGPGELRIDPPSTKPAKKPDQVASADGAKPNPPAPKPQEHLSRLEKLRLDAQQKGSEK